MDNGDLRQAAQRGQGWDMLPRGPMGLTLAPSSICLSKPRVNRRAQRHTLARGPWLAFLAQSVLQQELWRRLDRAQGQLRSKTGGTTGHLEAGKGRLNHAFEILLEQCHLRNPPPKSQRSLAATAAPGTREGQEQHRLVAQPCYFPYQQAQNLTSRQLSPEFVVKYSFVACHPGRASADRMPTRIDTGCGRLSLHTYPPHLALAARRSTAR